MSFFWDMRCRFFPVIGPFARFPYLVTQNCNDFSSFFSCYLYKFILYIRPKFGTSLFKKIGVNTCLGTDRKSVMMIRV